MQIIKRIAVAAVAISLLAGSSVFAATADTSTPASFCTRISITTSQVNSLLTKLSDNRGSLRTKMLQDLSDRKTKRASEVATIRTDARAKFVSNLDKVGAKATTDAKKAAVATFKTTVLAAFTTRNQAIDAAVSAYQTAAQSTITDRENKVKDAATAFQTAVAAAISQAKTDCANKVAPATARATMTASIRAANQIFRGVITSLPDGTLVKLAQTRDQAIQAANAAFKVAVEEGRTTLKAALGTTTTPTPAQ